MEVSYGAPFANSARTQPSHGYSYFFWIILGKSHELNLNGKEYIEIYKIEKLWTIALQYGLLCVKIGDVIFYTILFALTLQTNFDSYEMKTLFCHKKLETPFETPFLHDKIHLYAKDIHIIINYVMDMTMPLIIWLGSYKCSTW